jgi:hypothetical protein
MRFGGMLGNGGLQLRQGVATADQHRRAARARHRPSQLGHLRSGPFQLLNPVGKLTGIALRISTCMHLAISRFH